MWPPRSSIITSPIALHESTPTAGVSFVSSTQGSAYPPPPRKHSIFQVSVVGISCPPDHVSLTRVGSSDGKHVNLGSRVHLKLYGYVVVPNVYGCVVLFHSIGSVYTACEASDTRRGRFYCRTAAPGFAAVERHITAMWFIFPQWLQVLP